MKNIDDLIPGCCALIFLMYLNINITDQGIEIYANIISFPIIKKWYEHKPQYVLEGEVTKHIRRHYTGQEMRLNKRRLQKRYIVSHGHGFTSDKKNLTIFFFKIKGPGKINCENMLFKHNYYSSYLALKYTQ